MEEYGEEEVLPCSAGPAVASLPPARCLEIGGAYMPDAWVKAAGPGLKTALEIGGSGIQSLEMFYFKFIIHG